MPRCSADLAPGQRVQLVQQATRVPVRVTAATVVALQMRVADNEERLSRTIAGMAGGDDRGLVAVAAPAQLILARQSDIYRFTTTVLASDRGEGSLAHSESVRRAQQRVHFRRSMAMAMAMAVGLRRQRDMVHVDPSLGDAKPRTGHDSAPEGEPWLHARLINLGGNGASLTNSGVAEGDRVTLNIPAETSLRIEMVVVRVSRRGPVAISSSRTYAKPIVAASTDSSWTAVVAAASPAGASAVLPRTEHRGR